jgi:hypothetical protein
MQRPSPIEHAKDFKNKVKVGNDKNQYVSKKDKNGVYKWVKITLKKSPEEYYHQFSNYTKPKFDTKIFTKNFDKLSEILKKNGFIFSFIKWGKYNPQFEYEYFKKDNKVKNNILYSENKLYWDARHNSGYMAIMHNIDKTKWLLFNQIFIKFFPNRTVGITSYNDAIKLFFNEKKNLKKDKEKQIFSLDIIFEDSKMNTEAFYYLNKIDKIVGKNIGYLDEYNKIIVNGKVNAYFNINFDKVDEFKFIIMNLKNNKYELPAIKKIKLIKI